jgi:hypothetical protein
MKTRLPLDVKVKLRAIRIGIDLNEIATKIQTDNGIVISKQRFCDMIKGRRPNDFNKYKSQIAEILGLKRL